MTSVTGIDSPIYAFDASQDILAIATGDGRVRLFSAAQERLLVDATSVLRSKDGDSAGLEKNSQGTLEKIAPGSDIYSCLAWGKQSDSNPALGYEKLLFLGTTNGCVKCYDVAHHRVRWTASANVNGPVVDISPSFQGNLLVLGRLGAYALLEIDQGTVCSRNQLAKQLHSRCLFLPDGNKAVVAGASIVTCDVASAVRLHKWTGHSNPVVALKVMNSKYVCSAAEGERSVAIWSLELSEKEKLKHKSSVAHISLDSPVAENGLSVSVADEGTFYISIVTDSGSLNLFRFSDHDGKPSVYQWAKSAHGTVLTACIEDADSASAKLTIVSGNIATPFFIKKTVEHSNKSIDIEVDDRRSKMVTTAIDTHEKGKISEDVSAIGSEPGVLLSKSKKRSNSQLKERKEADEQLDEEMTLDFEKENEVQDLTFAERIAKLKESTNIPHGDENIENKEAPEGPLKAGSLSVLLTQALQSSDQNLLEKCLAVRSDDIISKTVQNMNPKDVIAFLHAVVQRLQSSPTRGEALASWIHAILRNHAAYLAGVGGANETLAWLYQIIEARLSNYQTLLRLQGRLQMVLSNRLRAESQNDEKNADDLSGPLLTVHVGREGDIHVENPFGDANLMENGIGTESESEVIDDDFGLSDSEVGEDYMDSSE